MFNQIKNFINYLFHKRSELKDLEPKDAMLAKVTLDIHRKRTHSNFTVVPLFAVKQIHAIDRDNAIAKTEERAEILHQAKDNLLRQQILTIEILSEYLPSVSGIKVIKDSEKSYIAFEGNGRLVAMQKVFELNDNIQIEVEEYFFKDNAKIIKQLNKVREMNKL